MVKVSYSKWRAMRYCMRIARRVLARGGEQRWIIDEMGFTHTTLFSSVGEKFGSGCAMMMKRAVQRMFNPQRLRPPISVPKEA